MSILGFKLMISLLWPTVISVLLILLFNLLRIPLFFWAKRNCESINNAAMESLSLKAQTNQLSFHYRFFIWLLFIYQSSSRSQNHANSGSVAWHWCRRCGQWRQVQLTPSQAVLYFALHTVIWLPMGKIVRLIQHVGLETLLSWSIVLIINSFDILSYCVIIMTFLCFILHIYNFI